MKDAPRVLLFDLETAPLLGWAWQSYEADIIDLQRSWYILSFAYKWLGDKKIQTAALPDFPSFKKDKEDDGHLVRRLHALFDEADILVAHNGDKFDIRKANARFIHHNLGPPSPYKTVDTLKLARKHFAYTSNRLNDLCKYLRIGRKLPHTGWDMWRGAMEGDPKAWAQMRKYNAHDVELLEAVYLRLRPWSISHPNVSPLDTSCPVCRSHDIQRRGFNVAKKRITQRLQCRGCGHWFSGEKINGKAA